MTMMEERKCETCDKVSIHDHMCMVDNKGATFDCEYCGAKKVKYGHVCKKKADAMKYYCGFCGRVAVDKDVLCEPMAIPDETKAAWKDALFDGDLAVVCNKCGQPIVMPGHLCDPKSNKYKCKHCNKEIDLRKPGQSTHHMSGDRYKNAKYFCRLCGRLAIDPWEVCTPIKLK